MKKRIAGLLSSIALILLLLSGAFVNITKFILWLFTLQYSLPETSVASGIIIRLLTFVVSYSLVGIIFNSIGLFDSKLMSLAYFLISTLLGFLLAFVVWYIEKYILIIGIVFGIVLLGIIAIHIARKLIVRNQETNTTKKE